MHRNNETSVCKNFRKFFEIAKELLASQRILMCRINYSVSQLVSLLASQAVSNFVSLFVCLLVRESVS